MSVASSRGEDEAWVLPLTLCVIFTFMDVAEKEAGTRSEKMTQKSVIYCCGRLLHSQQPDD